MGKLGEAIGRDTGKGLGGKRERERQKREREREQQAEREKERRENERGGVYGKRVGGGEGADADAGRAGVGDATESVLRQQVEGRGAVRLLCEFNSDVQRLLHLPGPTTDSNTQHRSAAIEGICHDDRSMAWLGVVHVSAHAGLCMVVCDSDLEIVPGQRRAKAGGGGDEGRGDAAGCRRQTEEHRGRGGSACAAPPRDEGHRRRSRGVFGP
eukprot:2310966-Rhodomonas_salina.2